MLQLLITEMTSSGYQLEWEALPGVAYRVEAADNLLAPVWLRQGNSTTTSNGVGHFSGTLPNDVPTRFFRLTRPE